MKQCLNCETELRGPYCHHCGQKGSTHRYSLKSLLTHELVHSLWHVDKSILRNWWYVLLHPGREGHKNVAGKRAGQFPIVTLAVFATLFLLVAIYFRGEDEHMVVRFGNFDFSAWVRHNAKWLWLSMILLYALSNVIFFRRPRYNLAEHIVLATYIYTGFVTVSAIFLFLYRSLPSEWVWLDWLRPVVYLGYLAMASWQTYRSFYDLAGWIWRFLFSFFCFWLILFVIILGIALGLRAGTGPASFQIHYSQKNMPVLYHAAC